MDHTTKSRFSLRQAADLLGVTVPTVHRWIKQDRLKSEVAEGVGVKRGTKIVTIEAIGDLVGRERAGRLGLTQPRLIPRMPPCFGPVSPRNGGGTTSRFRNS